MIKSAFDNFYYLLFINTNNELVLEQYNELNNRWRTIGTIDLETGYKILSSAMKSMQVMGHSISFIQ